MTAYRFREKSAMAAAKEKHRDAMERFIALQFLFDKQWKAVKARTHASLRILLFPKMKTNRHCTCPLPALTVRNPVYA